MPKSVQGVEYDVEPAVRPNVINSVLLLVSCGPIFPFQRFHFFLYVYFTFLLSRSLKLQVDIGEHI